MRVFIAAAFVAALTASLSAQRTPRTPWGDPDLQGTYTNTYENGTSFERPDQFAGRTLEDVTGDELKKMRLAIQSVIPLDSRPRLGNAIHHDMGDARGRWEGDTLVVETTNCKERSVYRNANPEKLKVTERFSRTSPRAEERQRAR